MVAARAVPPLPDDAGRRRRQWICRPRRRRGRRRLVSAHLVLHRDIGGRWGDFGNDVCGAPRWDVVVHLLSMVEVLNGDRRRNLGFLLSTLPGRVGFPGVCFLCVAIVGVSFIIIFVDQTNSHVRLKKMLTQSEYTETGVSIY